MMTFPCPWCGTPTVCAHCESPAARDAAPVPVTADAPAATPLLWWLLLYFLAVTGVGVFFSHFGGISTDGFVALSMMVAFPLWWAILRIARSGGLI